MTGISGSIISEIINSGDAPISANKLSKKYCVSDHLIRKVINHARSEGQPICSSNRGYYYSTKQEDIKKTIDSLEHRIVAMRSAVAGLSKCVGGAE